MWSHALCYIPEVLYKKNWTLVFWLLWSGKKQFEKISLGKWKVLPKLKDEGVSG